MSSSQGMVDYLEMQLEHLGDIKIQTDIRFTTLKILASKSDAALLQMIVQAFNLRDVRGGRGLRKPFYIIMGTLYEVYPDLTISLLELVPHYGSWMDLFNLISYDIPPRYIFKIAAKQLEEDEKRLPYGGPVSFLAKWAPREGKRFKAVAKAFAYYLAGPQATEAMHSQIMASYRKRMSRLNLAMRTVETLECADRWDEINPARVHMGSMRVKMAAYMNEKRGDPTTTRKPGDEKRIACRENFQKFLETTSRPIFAEDSDRYKEVQAKVKEWIEGGWRGT